MGYQKAFCEDNSVPSSLLTKPNNCSSDLLSATMIHVTGYEPIYRWHLPHLNFREESLTALGRSC